MTFQLLNDKSMFAVFEPTEIMTLSAIKVLKETVTANATTLSEKDKLAWKDVWSIMAALPRENCSLVGFTDDFKRSQSIGPKDSHRAYGTDNCVVIINPKRFVSRAQNNEKIPTGIEDWGLDAAIKLGAHSKMIEKFIAEHNLHITYKSNTSKRANEIKKRFDAGDYKIEAYDPIANLAEVEACVVYVPGRKGGGGYLNNKGGWGPLGGARLFESSGAAYTTIRSQRISSAAVVHIGTQVLRLDEKSTLEKGFDNLQEAMSIVERKRIEQALNQASHEQLLERLAQFEQEQGTASTVRKKKM